ncbi:MAG: hypothetical protein L6R42_008666 [Xanthoria sp. 1 TBL-2021]|nr:MAG: hypothetical protein L6R42_008666 [Xanthoria sp. 1 TBL-2021]
MTVCMWNINTRVFKDCPSSICASSGCIEVSDTTDSMAVKALESGTDFNQEQRTAVQRLDLDIHEAISKTTPINHSIPATSALAFKIADCRGTGSTPFQAFSQKDSSTSSQINHFQSVSIMYAYQNHSFEELRLADYARGRHYGNGSGQALTSFSTSSTIVDLLENMSRRLASAEDGISRLQCENAMLRSSAATTMDLLLVQQDLDRLRLQVSTSDYSLKKRKIFSPSSSLPSQTTIFNGFPPTTAPSMPTATTSTTPGNSLFSKGLSASTPASSASLFAPAPTTPSLFRPTLSGSLFGQASGSSQHTPASNTPSLFGGAPKGSLFGQTSNVTFQSSPAPTGMFTQPLSGFKRAAASNAAPQPSSTTSVPPLGSASQASMPTPTTNPFASGGNPSPNLFAGFFGDK